MYFLNYSKEERNAAGGYDVSGWLCEGAVIPAAGTTAPINFNDYVITLSLKLVKGVNCISLITANSNPVEGSTLTAESPVIDCIKITTTAQLGMYEIVDNNKGTNGCFIQQ